MTPRFEQIEKLLAASPNDVELRYMLAMEHKTAGHTASALGQFDECLRRDPHYIPAYFQKANTYLAAGQTDDARAALSAGIKQAHQRGELHAAEEMEALLNSL